MARKGHQTARTEGVGTPSYATSPRIRRSSSRVKRGICFCSREQARFSGCFQAHDSPAPSSIIAFRRHILESRTVLPENHLDCVSRSVALLGDNDLGHSLGIGLVTFVVLL